MDKSEKLRRNEIKRSMRKGEKEAILNSCPIPVENLNGLFEFLESKLVDSECKDRFTIAFEYLDTRGLMKEAFVDWSLENGGGCDCEILFNIEGAIND